MKIFIIGDSHTGALNRGLKLLEAADALKQKDAIRIKSLGGGHTLPTPFFEDAGDHIRMVDPYYKSQISRIPPVPPGINAIGLSMPLFPMRVVYAIAWKKLSLARQMPGRSAVSRAVFRQMVLADQLYVLQFAQALQRLGFPVLSISAPGLFRDHRVLNFMEPDAVLEIFQSGRTIMKEELTKRSLPFIDIPDECLDPEGYMLPKFRHTDLEDEHHANAEFGALMIRQVEDWLGGVAELTPKT
ncbi:MAG: hypothetical protein ACOH2H_25790 [Cypionkella sp.]